MRNNHNEENQEQQENQNNHNFQNPNFVNNSSNTDLVGNKNSTVKKIQFYVGMIMGTIIVLFIIITLLQNILSSKEAKEVKEVEATSVKSFKKSDLPKEEPQQNPFAINQEQQNPFQAKEEDIFSAVSKTTPPKPQIIKGTSGTMVNNQNGGGKTGGNSKSTVYDSQIDDLEKQKAHFLQMEQNFNKQQGSSRADFSGETYSPMVAKLNEFNPDLLLPKGSYIGCSLDTRFVSAIAGSTSCTISQNVYSSNGNVLLIEKGSKLFGTYKGDQANDGTSRYFVVWQEVRTPQHLRIPLNSGASDELGGAGLEGEIDHKWLMRFGSSIMLSAVDDIFNVLASELTKSNKNNNSGTQIDYTENSRDNASNIASIALEKFINIKPTVYKQHGDLVGVYVNRDVDFSQVYKLTKKNDK